MNASSSLRQAVFPAAVFVALLPLWPVLLSGQESVEFQVQGKTYRAAKLTNVFADRISFSHAGGVASILLEKLTNEDIVLLNSTSGLVSIPLDWQDRLKEARQQQAALLKARMEAARQEPVSVPTLAPSPEPAPPAGTSVPPPTAPTTSPSPLSDMMAGYPPSPPLPPTLNNPAGPVVASGGLRLASTWNEPFGGNSRTMLDLRKLFENINERRLDSQPYPDLELIPGIYYLMPYQEALKQLQDYPVTGSDPVDTPGLPQASLVRIALDGQFGDGFNKMVLVTDSAGQIISVQFVDQSPGNPYPSGSRNLASAQTYVHLIENEWKVYNFINHTWKGTSTATALVGLKAVPNKTPALYQVESEFYDSPRNLKEKVRWFVPQPIVNLLYYTASLKGSGLTTGGLTTGQLRTGSLR